MRRTPKLGQHFLKHAWAAAKLAHAVSLRSDESIVEIGPGKGALTRELLALGPVIAIEKDPKLVAHLHEAFRGDLEAGRLQLVQADVRDVDVRALPPYVLAANIPYYITGEILRTFLSAKNPPREAALLVQKEVAERITSSKESILSLSVKAYGNPKVVGKVPARHFSPAPSVDSAILLVDDISREFFNDISEDAFFALVHAGFASKRKMLINNLSQKYARGAVSAAFEEYGIPPKARAEDVALGKWKLLAKQLLGHK